VKGVKKFKFGTMTGIGACQVLTDFGKLCSTFSAAQISTADISHIFVEAQQNLA